MEYVDHTPRPNPQQFFFFFFICPFTQSASPKPHSHPYRLPIPKPKPHPYHLPTTQAPYPLAIPAPHNPVSAAHLRPARLLQTNYARSSLFFSNFGVCGFYAKNIQKREC